MRTCSYFLLALQEKYNGSWLFLEVIVQTDEMHDPSLLPHKFASFLGPILSALHHTAAMSTVSLGSNRKTKEERVEKI